MFRFIKDLLTRLFKRNEKEKDEKTDNALLVQSDKDELTMLDCDFFQVDVIDEDCD